jgi:hypothetical protein
MQFMVCREPIISPIVGDKLQFKRPVFTPITPGGGGICANAVLARRRRPNATSKPNKPDLFFIFIFLLSLELRSKWRAP